MMLITTECSDLSVHRARIEGRQRFIPDWYELDWSPVEHALASWQAPDDADLHLDTAGPWDGILGQLRAHFDRMGVLRRA